MWNARKWVKSKFDKKWMKTGMNLIFDFVDKMVFNLKMESGWSISQSLSVMVRLPLVHRWRVRSCLVLTKSRVCPASQWMKRCMKEILWDGRVVRRNTSKKCSRRKVGLGNRWQMPGKDSVENAENGRSITMLLVMWWMAKMAAKQVSNVLLSQMLEEVCKWLGLPHFSLYGRNVFSGQEGTSVAGEKREC